MRQIIKNIRIFVSTAVMKFIYFTCTVCTTMFRLIYGNNFCHIYSEVDLWIRYTHMSYWVFT